MKDDLRIDVMDIKYIVYFFIGGTVVSVITYFADHSRGLLSAFFATLPTLTLITFITIYSETGQQAVLTYAKGLLIMLFPWFAYIFSVIFLTPRFGFIASLITGLALYLVLAFLIMFLKR